ncbi:MAG: hypothetical protein LBQ59_01375 [Candidatus Peribacteria bacterium]|nr:hypothetical protein [Candidatus Peribacteria bacterium]
MSFASKLAIFGSTQTFASQSVSKIITFSLFSVPPPSSQGGREVIASSFP